MNNVTTVIVSEEVRGCLPADIHDFLFMQFVLHACPAANQRRKVRGK